MRRSWTPQELSKLDALIDQGLGYATIARRLKRSYNSVKVKAKRLRRSTRRAAGLLTTTAIAELLGLGCQKTVARWITDWGWLKATNQHRARARHPRWRITWEALYAFLEDERTWMAWDPRLITEATLREWTEELRAGRPQWIPIGEAARRKGVKAAAVNNWIHHGLIRSVKYGNHWLREDEVAAFVAPIDRVEPSWCNCCGRMFRNLKALTSHRNRLAALQQQRAA